MEAIRYGAGGMPMPSTEKKVEPVEPVAETKNEKQETLQEILEVNPDEDGFGEEHGEDDEDV